MIVKLFLVSRAPSNGDNLSTIFPQKKMVRLFSIRKETRCEFWVFLRKLGILCNKLERHLTKSIIGHVFSFFPYSTFAYFAFFFDL